MTQEPRRARTQSEWDERYRVGDLPWDAGEPAPQLVEQVGALGRSDLRVLELGCGTGTNAIWLAEQGFEVVASDISPTAIQAARSKAAAAGVDERIAFLVHDILAAPPVTDQSVDLVFDRGVFHTMRQADGPLFARRVHAALRPAGLWLSLSGNADETTEGRGPPRLTAAYITRVVEPLFLVRSLRAIRFRDQEQAHLAWAALLERRDEPR